MKSSSSHMAGATTSFERMAAGKRGRLASERAALLLFTDSQGTKVNLKREEWTGSGLRTKEHEQWHNWVGVTHVALALRYVLAF